tara:strand:- start:3321 stop:3659 length:339 start_codon:yes stop_codon:yes gene_type:complete
MSKLIKYGSTFLIAGLTVSGISYLGNLVNPAAAGVISGIPISIPSTLLIKGRDKQKEFIWSAFLMVSLLAIITGLCAYLIIKLDITTIKAVIISFLAWVCGAFLYYKFIVEK